MVYRRLKVAKRWIDQILKGPMLFLSRQGVTPMHLTLASFPCGLLGVYFLFDNTPLATLFVCAYVALDVLDGTLARATGAESDFGGKVDFLFDRVIALAFLVKYYHNSCSKLLPVVGIIAVLLVSATEDDYRLIKDIIGRSRGQAPHTSPRQQPGRQSK